MLAGLRLAVGTLTVLPVRVTDVTDRAAGAAMVWAPAVGAGLGAAAGLVAWLATAAGLGRMAAGVAALATLAALTRGLHLDGLADTADGLGSGAPPDEALRIMKAPDIGPFGVVALGLILLAQVAALSELPGTDVIVALAVGGAAGRLGATWACRRGVAAARRDGLGALVAETVSPAAALTATAATVLGAVGAAWLTGLEPLRAALAVGAALAAALAVQAHCRRRLGGITGDVLGAVVETATTAALIVFATG